MPSALRSKAARCAARRRVERRRAPVAIGHRFNLVQVPVRHASPPFYRGFTSGVEPTHARYVHSASMPKPYRLPRSWRASRTAPARCRTEKNGNRIPQPDNLRLASPQASQVPTPLEATHQTPPRPGSDRSHGHHGPPKRQRAPTPARSESCTATSVQSALRHARNRSIVARTSSRIEAQHSCAVAAFCPDHRLTISTSRSSCAPQSGEGGIDAASMVVPKVGRARAHAPCLCSRLFGTALPLRLRIILLHFSAVIRREQDRTSKLDNGYPIPSSS